MPVATGLKDLPRRASLCAVALALLLAPSAGARAAASCSWKVSPSVAPEGLSEFYGVAAGASNDAWAVGLRPPPDSVGLVVEGPTLAEHWDGRRWRVVPTPAGAGVLLAVSETPRREAWAVGARGTRALIEHWDGTRWNIVPSPNVGKSVLYDVDAVSSDDVWAVGKRSSWEIRSGGPLIEHWNGKRWRVIPGASRPGPKLELRSVSVTQIGEVWSVGMTDGARCLERSDRASWRFLPLPAGVVCFLWAIDAHSSHDVWVSEGQTILKWDGSHWRHWRLTGRDLYIPALAVVSASDVWVAGAEYPTSSEETHVYFAHWNGARWHRVNSSPSDDRDYFGNAEMNDISAVSGDDVWAVGDAGGRVRVERYTCSESRP